MAEKPNVHGSGNRCRRYIIMCSFGSDGAATSFCVLACPLRQSSVYISLSRGVVLGHSSTLCDQPRKAFTGHRVDVDILHISYADIFIV